MEPADETTNEDDRPTERFGPVRIDHVELYVSEREAATEWYSRVLGLHVLDEFREWASGGGPLILSGDNGDTKLALFEGSPRGDREAVSHGRVAFRVGGDEFADFLDRVDELDLAAVDGDPVEPDDVVDHGLSHSLYFADPDGNALEVTTYDPVAFDADDP